MQESLKVLLRDVLDYAGLFPPASLDLDSAIQTYAECRATPEAWMLARFVCPAGRLASLDTHRDLFAQGAAYRFSALGEAAGNPAEFNDKLHRLYAQVDEFERVHAGKVRVEAVETRASDDLSKDVSAETLAQSVISFIIESHLARGDRALPVFVEAPPGAAWQQGADALIRAISNANGRSSASPRIGFKLRTGSVTADGIPSVARVAWAIVRCRDHGVPLKFTAGLHHPIRMHRSEVQAKMHGFLNVFVAGVLAHAYAVDPLSEREVTAILECEDPRQFEFHDTHLEIGQRSATLDQIRRVREQYVTSFGSCSFAEPVQDLRDLGWW